MGGNALDRTRLTGRLALINLLIQFALQSHESGLSGPAILCLFPTCSPPNYAPNPAPWPVGFSRCVNVRGQIVVNIILSRPPIFTKCQKSKIFQRVTA